MKHTGKLIVCKNGHSYYRSTDCPICPQCEKGVKPGTGFLATLSAPARRAPERDGITTLSKLASFSESEILVLHGVGPATLPKLRSALKQQGMTFRKKNSFAFQTVHSPGTND